MDVKEMVYADKLRIVTGQGKWHTADCDGKYRSIHLSDGPHGLRKQDEDEKENNKSYVSTCFPTASAVASSWDTKLISRMAKGIASEAKAEQVSILLGPGTNIKRSPTCGRNFEYFSEDPYLSGKMSSSYVKAVQDEGLGTSLKHFAGNSQETLRMTANSMIDERALREIYLRAFEICVKESQPATIMASYNRINGEYACRNKTLLTDILRKDWGFEGAVVSDWGACNDLGEAVEAGMDLEMPDSCGFHMDGLKEALKSGKTSEISLNRAADKICKLVNKYGIYEPDEYVGITDDLLEANYNLAREIEENSAVLLKNDGILPLKPGHEIVVIGSMAKNMRFQGGGSSHIKPPRVKDAISALREHGFLVTYEEGYDSESDRINAALEKQALEAARKAKAKGVPVLFFGGLTDITEGEGYDRASFSMPENQTSVFDRIKQINQDLIFVSFGGSPYDMKAADSCRAVLMMYLGGEAVGDACASILSGKVNPSGRLAETFPFRYEDTPAYGNYATRTKDIRYRESIFVGYRYYDTFNIPVHFKFGFGMSYTSFMYNSLKVTKDGDKVKAKVSITNGGKRDGAEVVQIYVKNSKGDFMRPVRELRGFDKIFLKAGETGECEITLDDRSFSIYDADLETFVRVNGEYEIEVSAAVGEVIMSEKITIDDGMDFIRNDREVLASYFPECEDVKSRFSESDFRALYGREQSRFDDAGPGDFDMCNSIRELSKYSFMGRVVFKLAKAFVYNMYKGRPKDDPEVMMAIEGLSDGTLDLVLCEGGGAIPYKVGEAIVLEANKSKGKAFKTLFKKKK